MKKDVSMLVAGAGIVSALFTDLVKKVRERGGSDEDIHKLVTPAGEGTLGKIAELIVGAKQAAGNLFTVVVDYFQSLAEMISAGKYDWKNEDINEKHFPFPKLPSGTKSEFELELHHFNRRISSDQAIAELKSKGLRPATLQELLAFGAKYPGEQRKYPIVALGSIWRFWPGYRYVAVLWSGGVGRYLFLIYFGSVWVPYDRFLAVREF